MEFLSRSRLDVGQVAERVVGQWLRSQGFRILDERWHCRFGELDIVASEMDPVLPSLVFVEVKARRGGNWDHDGLLAITPSKRRKLIKTAQLYLGAHRQFEQYPCRFDVALVQVVSFSQREQSSQRGQSCDSNLNAPWVEFGRDRLRLKEYIRSAFDAV